MAPSPSVLLLALASFLLLLLLESSLASHSLRYFYTAVTGPSQGLPQFITVGYVDGRLIDHYDSDTKRALRKAPWMEKAGQEDPQYWDRQTQVAQNQEQGFKADLVNVPKYYNQSGGFHTWQWMYGCELRKDGSKGGYQQFGYDGKDYISFDKETLTWTAADLPALNTKRKWDPLSAFNQAKKAYLDKTCIEWLQRYLEYGKEELQRTDSPEVKVARKAGYDNMETLICRVDGFYPKDIDISWRKDGKDWIEDTFSGLVSPNSDGTYYKWLSVEIDPKDRERYKCHVEHDGLPEPVDLAWKEPASNLGLIVACVMGAVLLVAGIAGIAWIAVYIKKRQDGYKAPSDEEQEEEEEEEHPDSGDSSSSQRPLDPHALLRRMSAEAGSSRRRPPSRAGSSSTTSSYRDRSPVSRASAPASDGRETEESMQVGGRTEAEREGEGEGEPPPANPIAAMSAEERLATKKKRIVTKDPTALEE